VSRESRPGVAGLSHAIRRSLHRGGYRTRADVARASDSALLGLHGMSPIRLAELRRLIPREGTTEATPPRPMGRPGSGIRADRARIQTVRTAAGLSRAELALRARIAPAPSVGWSRGRGVSSGPPSAASPRRWTSIPRSCSPRIRPSRPSRRDEQ